MTRPHASGYIPLRMEAPQIRLYNTLTQNVDVFTPLTRGEVRMYFCGLTPYDLARSACTSPSCPTLAATGTCSRAISLALSALCCCCVGTPLSVGLQQAARSSERKKGGLLRSSVAYTPIMSVYGRRMAAHGAPVAWRSTDWSRSRGTTSR